MSYRTFSLLSTMTYSFSILILIFTTQWGRTALGLLSLFSRSSSWGSEVKALFWRLFYWSKVTQHVYGQAWVWIHFSCLLDWSIHPFILASMCCSSSMFLWYLQYAMHSAWAVVTAVNTADRELPWWISQTAGRRTLISNGTWKVVKEKGKVMGSTYQGEPT